jgi:hypothetical protein
VEHHLHVVVFFKPIYELLDLFGLGGGYGNKAGRYPL